MASSQQPGSCMQLQGAVGAVTLPTAGQLSPSPGTPGCHRPHTLSRATRPPPPPSLSPGTAAAPPAAIQQPHHLPGSSLRPHFTATSSPAFTYSFCTTSRSPSASWQFPTFLYSPPHLTHSLDLQGPCGRTLRAPQQRSRGRRGDVAALTTLTQAPIHHRPSSLRPPFTGYNSWEEHQYEELPRSCRSCDACGPRNCGQEISAPSSGTSRASSLSRPLSVMANTKKNSTAVNVNGVVVDVCPAKFLPFQRDGLRVHEYAASVQAGLSLKNSKPACARFKDLRASTTTLLGSGAQGCVFSVRRGGGAAPVAVKISALTTPECIAQAGFQASMRLKNDHVIASNLDVATCSSWADLLGPGVARAMGAQNARRAQLLLIQQFPVAPGKGLLDVCVEMHQKPRPMDPAQLAERQHVVKRVLLDMCSALRHLQQRRVAHCDLKMENMFHHPQRGTFMLDFGLATPVGDGSSRPPWVNGGTPDHMPPEVLKDPWFPVHYNRDTYALGLTVYQLLCGCNAHPYTSAFYTDLAMKQLDRNQRNQELVRLLEQSPFHWPAEVESACDPQLLDLIERFMHRDHLQRAGLEELEDFCLHQCSPTLGCQQEGAACQPSAPASDNSCPTPSTQSAGTSACSSTQLMDTAPSSCSTALGGASTTSSSGGTCSPTLYTPCATPGARASVSPTTPNPSISSIPSVSSLDTAAAPTAASSSCSAGTSSCSEVSEDELFPSTWVPPTLAQQQPAAAATHPGQPAAAQQQKEAQAYIRAHLKQVQPSPLRLGAPKPSKPTQTAPSSLKAPRTTGPAPSSRIPSRPVLPAPNRLVMIPSKQVPNCSKIPLPAQPAPLHPNTSTVAASALPHHHTSSSNKARAAPSAASAPRELRAAPSRPGPPTTTARLQQQKVQRPRWQ